MIMSSKYLLLPLLVLASSASLAQTVQQAPSSGARTVQNAPPPHPQQHEDEGARVFQQNCSRCHNTPEGFSPRISGTISRHMRVRASLSKHDEEVLLRFLNP
jgi:cytochrome c5